MKKALIICLCITSSVFCFAQKGLHIGVVGGPQPSWLLNLNDLEDPNIKYRTGWRYFIGAHVDYHFLAKLGVGAEFIYTAQGQNYYDPNAGGIGNYQKRLNYFQIPVLLNFNSGPGKILMFVGKIGPTFNFRTSGKLTSDAAIVNNTDLKPYSQSSYIGGVLGLGLGINIKKILVISAMVKFDAGFQDAFVHNPNPFLFSYYDSTNSAGFDTDRKKTYAIAAGFELGIKYVIHFGKG